MTETPYYLDEDSTKRYAYRHPQQDLLERCIGNDTPHLCLACARYFMVDSRAPIGAYPECSASEIVSTPKATDKHVPTARQEFLPWIRGGARYRDGVVGRQPTAWLDPVQSVPPPFPGPSR